MTETLKVVSPLGTGVSPAEAPVVLPSLAESAVAGREHMDPGDVLDVLESPVLESLSAPSAEELAIARELVRSARSRGVAMTGPTGLLQALTKTVIETALDEEMVDHLGYDKHDPAGRGSGNSRNGTRVKTVLTDNVGPVQIEVPRDRDGSFDPVIVKKRQRRLGGVDTIVLSLVAKGLTTGEVSAHFEEIYGASLSKDTISKITDRVLTEMAEWAARPLEKGRFLVNEANVLSCEPSFPSSHELAWTQVAEAEAGAIVDLCGHQVEVVGAPLSKVCSLGEVLAEQTVGVLVAAALPG